jgi:predicted permease
LDAFLTAIGVVAPVVLVLGLGYLFGHFREFTDEAKGLGSLVYWICLPVLIWRDTARGDPIGSFDPKLGAVVIGTLVIMGVVGYRYARLRKVPANQVGVIAQAVFRSNMMYIGLPIILYHVAASYSKEEESRAANLVAMTIAAAIPILNGGSIVLFILPHRHETGRSMTFWRVAKTIIFNPMIIAVLAGLLFALTPLKSWANKETVLGRTMDMIGAAALPMALFAVGAILDVKRAYTGWRHSMPIVAMKLLLMPAIGLLVLWHLNVRDVELAVGVILLGCPTAAASHALAVEMHGDDVLAGDLVAVTTVLCPLTLVFWVAVLQGLR